MYEQVDMAIDDLLLDHENPRLGSVKGQSAALKALIALSVRNFRTMMTSIKEHGLDPGDLFYLVDEVSETGIEGYTVIDGNRRLAALMVLRQPTLLAGADVPEHTAKRFREIADGFDADLVGETRSCVLFDSRADAEDWILRRHGRNLEGEERIAWGPLEIQRFQGDRSVLDIIDFAARNAGFTPEEWSATRAKLERRSYVLRRFLESRAGRDAMALDAEDIDGNSVPTSKRGTEFLARLLKRLLEDVASGAIDTRQYNKADQIKEYFEELPENLQPTSDKGGGQPKRFCEMQIVKESEPSPPPQQSEQETSPKTKAAKVRDTLAPKQLEFVQPTNSKGQQFVREATKLRLKETPLSCAFILRGFIQFVVDLYMIDNNMPFWENEKQLEMHVRASRVIDHLITAKKAKRGDLSGIKRRLAEKANNHPSSIQALNDYHHAQYQVPDPDALRAGWDDATPLFIAILGKPSK